SAVLTAVIGFSLQDTLGNVMGGMAVQLDRSLAVGDWVRVGDVEGRVTQIRWRHTALETRNWDTVLIPNSLLARSQVTVLGRRAGISPSIPAQQLFITEDDASRRDRKAERELADRAAALARVDLFDPLTDDERRELAARLRTAPFVRGETIVRQGARGDSLYV